MKIQDFINDLFSQKPDEKRNKWIQIFLDQEYQTVEDLANLSQDNWKLFDENLPQKIVSDIKNEIKKLFGNGKIAKNEEVMSNDVREKIPEIKKCQQNKTPLEKIELDSCQKYVLDQQEIQNIHDQINENIDPQKIVKRMGAKSNSPKQLAILSIIRAHLQSFRPFPQNAKKFPPKENQTDSLSVFLYESYQLFTRKYYTFLNIGETGTGKSTFIDFTGNFLNGVEYKDNWRWKVVDESHLNKKPAGASKTSVITEYYINDVQNKFNIRIIDTPGFGDTSGIKVDNEITDQFEKLFNEIDEIDYILLTIKASETRLRHGSKYIYDRVQQLFGKDAKDRFILICTFADSTKPNCLQVIQKDIYFSNYFTFNNSALYTSPKKGNAITKLSWKMGMESMKKFSDYVIQSDRIPLSLKTSKEILEYRKSLYKYISTSHECFKQVLRQHDIAQINFKNLKECQKKKELNKRYQEKYIETKYEEEKLNKYVQFCKNCQITCCLKCEWPENQTSSTCNYFWGSKIFNRKCPICPQHCSRQSHIRTNKKITRKTVLSTRTIDFKKQFYEEGVKEQEIYKKQCHRIQQNIKRLQAKRQELNEEIIKLLRQLQQTALKPVIFTDQQYYQQMIITENENQEEGWMERVKYLKQQISKLNTVKEIQEKTNNQVQRLSQRQLDPPPKQVDTVNKKSGGCSIY